VSALASHSRFIVRCCAARAATPWRAKGTTRRILDLAWASIDTAHRSIQHTVHYSELSPTPFKDFWRDSRVPKGAFAALRTDMYKDWDADPERFKRSPFPAWSPETIKFLYEERGVTATGHESMDTDTTDKMESETYILQHGHYQIEVMANLDKVPPTGALIVVSWPKVRNGLGFPARAFAILP